MTSSPPSPAFPVFEHPRPIAIAHRGGAGEAPENTLAAFANAARLGLRYMEIDVRATRDGVVVVFHDDRLERLTGRPGAIEELTWSELRGARIHSREPIPRLDEVLEAWPGLRFIIEVKSDRSVDPLAEAIRRTGAIDRVCVASFSDQHVARLHRLLGRRLCTSLGRLGVARLRLASFGLPMGAFTAGAIQVPVRHWGLPVVDRRMIAAARRRGMQVHVWTVDEVWEMERLIDLGVDGLVTDYPSRLKAVLQGRGLWAD